MSYKKSIEIPIDRWECRPSARDLNHTRRLRARKRLLTRSLTALAEGMKILCIKGHVHSSINDFRERIRAITNPSFAVGRLN